MLALFNILTQYKMNKVTKKRFQHQLILWLVILFVLICSFPFYNYLVGKPLLDSAELSLFDIVQTTAIIMLFYGANSQRQKIDRAEKTIRDLHQEISIKLSEK
jgi:hypothetical protein